MKKPAATPAPGATLTLSAFSAVLFYCRPGFEKEMAQEITDRGAELAVFGYVKAKPDSGYVLFVPHQQEDMAVLMDKLRWKRLVFARQLVFVAPLDGDLPTTDRVSPLLARAKSLGSAFSSLQVETADTNEAKELLAFCRKFSTPFTRALEKAGLLQPEAAELPWLHLFFLGSAAAYVGVSFPGNHSGWFMGIPRLRMPKAAPSRSTLKLAEALLELVGERHLDNLFHAGLTAVDLGAAPGGWTWQLVQRELNVTAIDNGPMDPALMASGQVEHLRVDGFHYHPKRPVDWLVCDMVESPSRIAGVMGEWLASGWCRQALFNLKLPMKKRYDELERCRDIIDARLAEAGIKYRLDFKQLYHDREEVTGYLRPVKG